MVETVLAALQQPQLWWFAVVGFVAQMFDGALGMGFGAISSTVLAATGLPREIASASVNGAKLFTGAASGAAHLLHRNVDARMLLILGAAGALGGAVGATLLARYNSRWIGVAVSGYLLLVGAFIVWRAFRALPAAIRRRQIGGVGLAGGFLEALAGVWGPLVTSNLVAFGATPRLAVGTGNVAETFVAGVVFTVLVHHIGLAQLSGAVLGLLGGALVAAPFAARVTSHLPQRPLMIGVGVLVIALSIVRLVRDLGT
jgi:uncharacterized membrane protein YfcA